MRPADCFAPLYLPPLRGDKRVTKVSDIDVIWFVERSEGNKVAQKEKKRGLFTQNYKFWFFSGLFSVGRRGYAAVRACVRAVCVSVRECAHTVNASEPGERGVSADRTLHTQV
jgi:hypothetical protein